MVTCFKRLVQVLPPSFEQFQNGELKWMPEHPFMGPNRVCFQLGLADTIKISPCMCWLDLGYLGEGIKYSTFP